MIDPPHWGNFDASTQNQVDFDPDTNIQPFSTPKQEPNIPISTWKSSQVRSPTLKSSQFRPPTQKRSLVRCSHWNQVIFGPHTKTKLASTSHTKTKSVDLHIESKSFSTRTKRNKSVAIPAQKPSQFWSIHENQTIIGPNTTKSISTPACKTVNFEPTLKRYSSCR